MGKVKSGIKSVTKAVDKGLTQIDPTTKEGLANLATGGMYGAHKNIYDKLKNKEDGTVGETESEKAAGDVAIAEYDFAREMDFVKDEYANRVERLGTDQMQSAVMGRANIDAQKQVGAMVDNTENALNQSGIDPSSGRATSTMTDATIAGGDALGNSKSQAAFALDSAHLEGKNNRIAMAMGEKTKAVAGLQDIAAGSNRLAINKANNKFNDNAANQQAIGTAVGMGSQAYLGREKD
tara:strand:+ start:23971 stop:24681 length:711 start_codon:yes stop_codon:yes gene_type:complete